MTREKYNQFLELKREVDREVDYARIFFSIHDCCKMNEYTGTSVELEGYWNSYRGGGPELETGSIPVGFLIDDEKTEAYEAETRRLVEVRLMKERQAIEKVAAETDARRILFEKLKNEFDGKD